ncbi:hypothetical protein EJP69_19750 [Variovorax gossypii]|uniref:Uncharacterized protein n=1 Tax=Variovorax gossypii TaxID=1679495 RepID=A0A3S0IYX8_9BURK|nr:hypothetical protein [Variovorax gossypii]RTQ32936.1 hypothetical protein EJP69_19750 [Variovorax gossypii]
MVDAGGIASKASDQQAEFVSLTLAPGPAVASDIHLELRREQAAIENPKLVAILRPRDRARPRSGAESIGAKEGEEELIGIECLVPDIQCILYF